MGNINSKKQVKVVLIGLDNSGKTCLLRSLTKAEPKEAQNTVGFNATTYESGNVKFFFCDAGGGKFIRNLWRHYYEDVDVVAFVVDSSDKNRLEEAKSALHQTFPDIKSSKAHLFVVANKSDKDDTISEDILKSQLELDSLKIMNRDVQFVSCSANKKENLKLLLKMLSVKK